MWDESLTPDDEKKIAVITNDYKNAKITLEELVKKVFAVAYDAGYEYAEDEIEFKAYRKEHDY